MGCRPDSVLGENTERFVLLLQRAQFSYVCFVPESSVQRRMRACTSALASELRGLPRIPEASLISWTVTRLASAAPA
jgi:hypothetical protein